VIGVLARFVPIVRTFTPIAIEALRARRSRSPL
jgi:membrane protein DedA with SNARE-associated domain